MNRSALFTRYNLAKATFVRSGAVSTVKLNRALGVAQRNHVPYITTQESCSCADFFYRGRTCKHQIALVLRDGE
jgi:predicted nucleic acid-binding Zn finger protein